MKYQIQAIYYNQGNIAIRQSLGISDDIFYTRLI